VVALEADWPDAARIDAYVRQHADLPAAVSAFQRFPIWMWRNRPVRRFVDRLLQINRMEADPRRMAGVYGLDLYSLPSSMDAVIDFVRRHDPQALSAVRKRYGCLAAWSDDPVAYGARAQDPSFEHCAGEAQAVLDKILAERLSYIEASDRALFDALQNARVVAASEAYYRAMYEGTVASWNLRDRHMFETLEAVLEARGPEAKAVVWAHNSHVGDASATGMGLRGEINLGQLCRQAFGTSSVLIGLGTDRGTVTAASNWNGEIETKVVRPSLVDSWGAVMRDVDASRFFLDMRHGPESLQASLQPMRPERFIGVIYRPETERQSHYVPASLSKQFDAWLWFQATRAVEPLPAVELKAMPQTYPFAL